MKVIAIFIALLLVVGCRPSLHSGRSHSGSQSDVITGLFSDYFDWTDQLPQEQVAFLLRALLLFGLPCLFCGWAFTRGNRSVLVQSLCFAAGLLLGAESRVKKLTLLRARPRHEILNKEESAKSRVRFLWRGDHD